jgi:hypothetical protein
MNVMTMDTDGQKQDSVSMVSGQVVVRDAILLG